MSGYPPPQPPFANNGFVAPFLVIFYSCFVRVCAFDADIQTFKIIRSMKLIAQFRRFVIFPVSSFRMLTLFAFGFSLLFPKPF